MNLKQIAQKLWSKTQDDEGWIRQGQFTPGQQTKDYFNPESNNGSNFWSTKPANLLSKAQQAVQTSPFFDREIVPSSKATFGQRFTENVSNFPRFNIPVPQLNTGKGIIDKPVNILTGLAKSIPETYLNIGRNLTVGSSRGGELIGGLINKDKLPAARYTWTLAPLAEAALDYKTMGSKNLFNNTNDLLKSGNLKTALKAGTKEYGTVGGASGLLRSLGEQKDKIDLGKTFYDTAYGTIGGIVFGSVTGAGSTLKAKVFGGYKDIGLDEKTAQELTKKHYVRSENRPIVFRQPKAQVDFNTKINTLLKRPIDTPVYSDDLKQYINLTQKLPNTELNIGNTIKKISKDNPIEIDTQPIKTGGDELINEARKYKSAEDFVRDKVYSTFQAKNVNEGKQSYKNFLESRKGMEIDKKIIDNFNFFNTNEKIETLRAVETYNIDNLKGYPEVDLINRIKSSYGEVIGNNVEQISKENKALKLTDIWNKANLSPESVSPIKTGEISTPEVGKYKWYNQSDKKFVKAEQAKSVPIEGLDTFVHKVDDGWRVTESKSGAVMSDGSFKTQKEAIDNATQRLKAFKQAGNDINAQIQKIADNNVVASNWKPVNESISTPEVSPIKTGDNLINEAKKYKSANEFWLRMPEKIRDELRSKGIRGQEAIEDFWNKNNVEKNIISDLNPTGGVYVDYTPEKRMSAKLANNITTLDKTMGKSPNDTITIYRGTIEGQKEINPGDFITTDYDLAKSYTDKNVISKKVKLSDILDDINEPLGGEYIYRPKPSPIKTGETIKLKETPKVKVSSMAIEQPELKQRGFSVSVQEAPNVSKKVKAQVLGGYETKPNDVLMGEAKALLSEGVDLKNINKIENIDQKIAATIQEALNLDAAGKHDEAAALFNNLSELGTQVGRGTQAFSLLNKMSPEAISLSVAGKIKKYNLSHNKKLPELTGSQQKQLSAQVKEALKFPSGSKERGIAIGKLNETINSFIPSTFADKFITTWKAGLLSSLRTHERNIVGNTIMQGSEQASLYPASVADWLMSKKTGTRTLVPSQKGSLSGAVEGGQTAADVMKYGFDPSGTEIGKYEVKKVTWGNNPLEQALKKATDTVFNTLEAEDKVFWKSSYNRSLYNQAAAQAINDGKRGNAKYIQKLFDNATEEMKQTAFNDANYATFKDKNMLSGAIGQFKSWVNRQTGPAAEAGKIVSEMLMPFTGVPTSIVGKTVAYSPIGLVKGSVDFGRVVSGSEVPGLQRLAAQEIGRGVIGSGIFGLGAYLMSQGLMTGQAKDQKERDQWALEGKQENSVLVNGKWRSINSVGPQTLVLLAGAKANETANDPKQNLGTYGFSTLNDQLNQTFLSGVQQPLAAINDPQGNKAKSYLGGQVSSLIPNIVKDTSKAFDPLKREVDTSTIGSSIKGRVQQSIPFARNKMIPQRDVLGNEIAQTPTGIGAYFDLFNSTTPISNNVVNELSRLNQAGYNKTPTKLNKNQTIGGEKMTLNQAQLDRLEIVSGLATDKALNDLFNTTAYQSLDDAEKQDAIGDTITKVRKNVRANINLDNIQEKSYVKSSDSQLAELGGFNLFTKSVTTDPKAAMNALLTGNPIRKISDGNIVVLERENDVGSYDLGDTTSQVDHAIPLSLGGTNEVRNLQILTNEEHAIKTKTDMYLLNQVQSGQMSLKDAQEKAKNWRDTALSLPKNAQSQIIDEIDSESADKQSDGSKVYKLVSDAGNVTLVDLGTPIQQPEYTGFDAIDKKLKSSYKSAITKRINNIVKLYEDGQLSATEANKLISELKTQSGTGTKKTKKAKKITFKVSSPKALPKINIKISSPVSKIKLKSAPKVKLATSSNRKYTIKA